jgi:hypothetical protein
MSFSLAFVYNQDQDTRFCKPTDSTPHGRPVAWIPPDSDDEKSGITPQFRKFRHASSLLFAPLALVYYRFHAVFALPFAIDTHVHRTMRASSASLRLIMTFRFFCFKCRDMLYTMI